MLKSNLRKFEINFVFLPMADTSKIELEKKKTSQDMAKSCPHTKFDKHISLQSYISLHSRQVISIYQTKTTFFGLEISKGTYPQKKFKIHFLTYQRTFSVLLIH